MANKSVCQIRAALTRGESVYNDYSPEFWKCAQEGCDACQVLLEGVTRFAKEADIPMDWERIRVISVQEGSRVVLRVWLLPHDGQEHNTLLLSFYSPRDQPTPWPFMGNANHIPTDLNLEYAQTQIRTWLASCGSDHDKCALQMRDCNFVPTRLLQVDASDNAVFLVEPSSDKHEGRPYMTLSHCWGTAQPVVTTKANYAARKAGILTNELPKSFREAVALTRALHIGYLWIDSLCIIQEDEQDWALEAERMREVYASSYLNIAITHASDSSKGCFTTRWNAHIFRGYQPEPLTRLEIVRSKPYPYSVFVRHELDKSHDDFRLFPHQLRGKAPLLTRAWAYQERCLAPRTVHFHSAEMMFECFSGFKCECMDIDNFQPAQEEVKRLDSRLRIGPTSDNDGVDAHPIWRSWQDTVLKYAILNATFQRDKLPALSGIAIQYAKHNPADTYLAGIWKLNIEHHLMWSVLDNKMHEYRHEVRRSQPYRAPTWSWASLECVDKDHVLGVPITWCSLTESGILHPRFKILAAGCTPKFEGCLYGEVVDGLLKVESAFLTPIGVKLPLISFGSVPSSKVHTTSSTEAESSLSPVELAGTTLPDSPTWHLDPSSPILSMADLRCLIIYELPGKGCQGIIVKRSKSRGARRGLKGFLKGAKVLETWERVGLFYITYDLAWTVAQPRIKVTTFNII